MVFLLFCFKQKTAYEVRISDWSSDVCSSDLSATCAWDLPGPGRRCPDGGVRMWGAGPDGRGAARIRWSKRRSDGKDRSEELRGGEEWVSTSTSRGASER